MPPRSPNATYTRSCDHNKHNREMYNQCHYNPYLEVFKRLKKEKETMKKIEDKIFVLIALHVIELMALLKLFTTIY